MMAAILGPCTTTSEQSQKRQLTIAVRSFTTKRYGRCWWKRGARRRLAYLRDPRLSVRNGSPCTGVGMSTRNSPDWPRRCEEVFRWDCQALGITVQTLVDSSRKGSPGETLVRFHQQPSSKLTVSPEVSGLTVTASDGVNLDYFRHTLDYTALGPLEYLGSLTTRLVPFCRPSPSSRTGSSRISRQSRSQVSSDPVHP